MSTTESFIVNAGFILNIEEAFEIGKLKNVGIRFKPVKNTMDIESMKNKAGALGYKYKKYADNCLVLFDNNITVVSNGFKVLDADSLFQESFFADIDLSNLDTSEVTQMKNMFSHCGAKINFGGIDTSNVKSMDSMFYAYFGKSLDLRGLNTSNVENMDNMFSGIAGLDMLDISTFNTSKVKTMYNMLSRSHIHEVNFGHIDTSNVTEMSCMFDMANIDKLHINNILTSGVESMDCMFRQATIAEELDISNFDTSQVCEMMYMFSSLKVPSLKLGSFSTDGIVFSGMNEIFEGHAIDRLETSNEQLFMLWDSSKSRR